jgi:hypothetical protein
VPDLLALLQEGQIQRVNLNAESVLEVTRCQVDADVREFFDQDGNIKPLHTLTKAQAAMIVGVDVVMKSTTAGDAKIDRVLKIKLTPRDRYVEMAAKHFKLLTDAIQVTDAGKLNDGSSVGANGLRRC